MKGGLKSKMAVGLFIIGIGALILFTWIAFKINEATGILDSIAEELKRGLN